MLIAPDSPLQLIAADHISSDAAEFLFVGA
jgi:hypothetical protein